MTDNAFSRPAAYLAAEILDDLNDRDYVIEQVAAGNTHDYGTRIILPITGDPVHIRVSRSVAGRRWRRRSGSAVLAHPDLALVMAPYQGDLLPCQTWVGLLLIRRPGSVAARLPRCMLVGRHQPRRLSV